MSLIIINEEYYGQILDFLPSCNLSTGIIFVLHIILFFYLYFEEKNNALNECISWSMHTSAFLSLLLSAHYI